MIEVPAVYVALAFEVIAEMVKNVKMVLKAPETYFIFLGQEVHFLSWFKPLDLKCSLFVSGWRKNSRRVTDMSVAITVVRRTW